MNRSIKRSEELFERAKKVAPGGVHSPVRAFRSVGGTPRFIERAKGALIFDADGNEYVDFCLSWGPLIFGHADDEVLEAVHQALERGSSFGAAERPSLELAELMTSGIAPLEKVRFVNSGTEAVMSALRVARAATGRSKVLKFDGCYHGHADSMLVKAGSGLAEMASPDSAGVSEATASETIVAPLNDLVALERIFAERGQELAAVILEPVPANNGLLVQSDGFLKDVVRIARKSGTLVIFDEVITGFRVAFDGMAGLTGIQPDLLTYGKIIGGGFPVGAYGGRADLMDLVAPVGPAYQAGTLSANPVAMSAGLATLKKLQRENPYDTLEARTETLAQQLESAASEIQVQHFASMFWITFGGSRSKIRSIDQIPPGQKERFSKLYPGLLDSGIYLSPSGVEVNFLSTAHESTHLERLVEALQQSSHRESR